MKLETIKHHMLDYLHSSTNRDLSSNDIDSYYTEDGYTGGRLFCEIIKFWEKFKSDRDFIYVISGEYKSDIDLDGGRDYLIESSGIIPLLFDYLYNDIGYTLKKYNSIIHNTCNLTDDIEDMYNSQQIIRDTKIKKILE